MLLATLALARSLGKWCLQQQPAAANKGPSEEERIEVFVTSRDSSQPHSGEQIAGDAMAAVARPPAPAEPARMVVEEAGPASGGGGEWTEAEMSFMRAALEQVRACRRHCRRDCSPPQAAAAAIEAGLPRLTRSGLIWIHARKAMQRRLRLPAWAPATAASCLPHHRARAPARRPAPQAKVALHRREVPVG